MTLVILLFPIVALFLVATADSTAERLFALFLALACLFSAAARLLN